jgi:hypothetical protein
MMTSSEQVCVFACGLTAEEHVRLYWVQSKAEIEARLCSLRRTIWHYASRSASFFTALVMKRFLFWVIISCILLKVNLRFGGIYPHYLQGRRISQVRKLQLATCFMLVSCCLFGPEAGGDMFPRNFDWLSTDYTALYPRRQSSSTLSELVGIITGDSLSVIGPEVIRCIFLKAYARIRFSGWVNKA